MEETSIMLYPQLSSYLTLVTRIMSSIEVEKNRLTVDVNLLPGELEVGRAEDVILQTTLEDRKCDLRGLLVITNFKLSFVAYDDELGTTYRENSFLQRNDITLQNIDRIYQIIDNERREVDQFDDIDENVESIHIVCKNFRVLRFNFKPSTPEQCDGKRITETIRVFSSPNQHDFLFFHAYKESYNNDNRNHDYLLKNISLYNTKDDWELELKRCGAVNWQVRSSNYGSSMPMHYVVPSSFTENDYFEIAYGFRDRRVVMWVFSLGNVSLLRRAELMPTVDDSRLEDRMMDYVTRCDPMNTKIYFMDLSRCLPSNQDVQISYTKLRDLFTPESTRTFVAQDTRFYTHLEKSCWLLYVSQCLEKADEAATKMRNGRTVVLQENEARDMSCVISSLTQILLDPYYRTMFGFESLIQKDWVALGHPFCDRLGHVINSDSSEQSPLLLLFLDCVWQLLQQFPGKFEFSETFLTTLWDSAFLSIFDTFLFNSEYERQEALRKKRFVSRPIWEWTKQFEKEDLLFFKNPLYKPPKQRIGNAPSKVKYIKPQTAVRDLEIWMQCYYRWLPELDIVNGGSPCIEHFNRMISRNIAELQQQLKTHPNNNNRGLQSTTENDITISSFYPFESIRTNSSITDIFIDNGSKLKFLPFLEELRARGII